MSFSVIVVSWNTQDLLAQSLKSLAGSSAEILVVDNGSTDESVEIVRACFPHVRVIANKRNMGFAAANNQAIREATGDYVVLLNSDTETCGDALEIMAAFMKDHLRAGACGPRLLNSDRTLQPSAHAMLTPERELWRLSFLDRLLPLATYPMHKWDTRTPRRVEVIKGACLMLRRAALDQVGLLDESYFMYTEEVDLCYRLAQAGWELWWLPEAQVIHYSEASSRQMRDEMYIQLYRSKVQFYRKFGGEERAAQFKRYLRLVYAPRVVGTAAAARFRPALKARAQFYRRFYAEIPSL